MARLNGAFLNDVMHGLDPQVRLAMERRSLEDELAQPTPEERLAQIRAEEERLDALKQVERQQTRARYQAADYELRQAQRLALKVTAEYVRATERAVRARKALEQLRRLDGAAAGGSLPIERVSVQAGRHGREADELRTLRAQARIAANSDF